jgi:hypothetical protein
MAIVAAALRPDKLKVGVRSFEDDYLELEVNYECTASQLKLRLQETWNVGPHFQKILCGDSALGDDALLSVHRAPDTNFVPVRVVAALEPFVAKLHSPDSAEKLEALLGIENVGLKGTPSAIRQVGQALSQKDALVRYHAVRALSTITDRGDKAVVALLVRCLDDRDQRVVQAASEALQTLADVGDEAMISEAFKLLGSASFHARNAGVDAIGDLSERGDESAIMEALQRLKDPSWQIRCAAVGALAAVVQEGDRDAADVLRDRLARDPSRFVREAAQQALDTFAQ